MNQSEFAGIPLAAGSIFGARQWKIDRYGRLLGLTHQDVWTPGENAAFCNKGAGDSPYRALYMATLGEVPGREATPCGDVTSPDCACGFYAYFDTGKLLASWGYAVGIIEGYGKATIGTKGFRCEKARIVALCGMHKVGSPYRRLLERNYPDVPKFNKWGDMLAEFPLSTEYIPSPEADPEFWTRGALKRPGNREVFDKLVDETAEKMKGALDWKVVQGDYNAMMSESSKSHGFWLQRRSS